MDFRTSPGSAVKGHLLNPQPVVVVTNPSGEVITGWQGDVTLTLEEPGTLTGATSVPVSQGVATFTDLSVSEAGTYYILRAHAPGLADETSSTFHIGVPVAYAAPWGTTYGAATSWATAANNIQYATMASGPGGEVWVAAGTYWTYDQINGVSLYGGFAGSETARSQRDWVRNVTILDAQGGYSGLSAGFAVAPFTVDGFTIRNADGFALQADGGTAGPLATISHNIFTGNNSSQDIGALEVFSPASIHDNVFVNNAQTAIRCVFGTPVIVTNNTIVSNSAGVDIGAGLIANNIIANNAGDDIRRAGAVLSRNCLFGNGSGMTGPSDIQADPLFVDPNNGDFELTANSPCVDTADDGAWSFERLDNLGLPRVAGYHLDIGAYELPQAVPFTLADVARSVRLAAGITTAAPPDMRLTVDGSGRTDLRSAAVMARKVAGLAANPLPERLRGSPVSGTPMRRVRLEAIWKRVNDTMNRSLSGERRRVPPVRPAAVGTMDEPRPRRVLLVARPGISAWALQAALHLNGVQSARVSRVGEAVRAVHSGEFALVLAFSDGRDWDGGGIGEVLGYWPDLGHVPVCLLCDRNGGEVYRHRPAPPGIQEVHRFAVQPAVQVARRLLAMDGEGG